MKRKYRSPAALRALAIAQLWEAHRTRSLPQATAHSMTGLFKQMYTPKMRERLIGQPFPLLASIRREPVAPPPPTFWQRLVRRILPL